MGKRDKKLKSAKVGGSSSSEEENRKVKNPIETDDEEANEDLSLKIVEKAMLQACNGNPEKDGVVNIVTDLKKGKKKEKKKRKKSVETEVLEHAVSDEIDKGFKDFCGELFLVDNVKVEDKVQTDKAVEIAEKSVEVNPIEVPDNAVLRKLLRGPRYFDPPDNSWGACYNCGEEGHTTVSCTSARRKKPCFVCGSFEHNVKQCSKGHDCFICKQQGHRAKDCPEKNSSKICLKCCHIGHDMFSCRDDYCTDDLKEIQCYVCHKFGHLCCVDYGSPSKREVSCFRCGGSGHTGLACTRSHGETSGTGTPNSCYKCGGAGHFARECTSSAKGGDKNSSCYKCGGEGHFARECISSSSKKSGKRIREQSTPKQKSSKKNRDHIEARSAPHDLGKTQKKKKSRQEEFSSPVKTKHRGGWVTEDPEYYYDRSMPKAHNNWRSPATPSDRRRSRIPSYNGDYASNSHSARNTRDSNYSNSAVHGSSGYYQHRYSASRFGDESNSGMRRDYVWW